MFIKEVIVRNGKSLFGLMSKTRSYSYKELQAMTEMECEPLCFAILQLLRENRITQSLKGSHVRYAVR